MPPLSIYERQGTAARNDLNAEAISRFVRNQYANNRTQANLMVWSSILTQNTVARDIIGRNALLQRREAQLRELDEQLTRYYGEFGSVLNDKALDFLNTMANVKVPTVTSILAGFENARASRAENERVRVAEMERLMNLDTKLQTERLQLRREQIDNEMLVDQTRIKAMQDLMTNTNAVNQEAFKATSESGTWQELPAGRIYNSPIVPVHPIHDHWVDDRERVYQGRAGKGANVINLEGIDLGQRNTETPVQEEKKETTFRLRGDTPGYEYFIRGLNEEAPTGDAVRYADLMLNLANNIEKFRFLDSAGTQNPDPYLSLLKDNQLGPEYIKALKYMQETLQGGQGTTGEELRLYLTTKGLVGDVYKDARNKFLTPTSRGGWNFDNPRQAIDALQIWGQMLNNSTTYRNELSKQKAASQNPPSTGEGGVKVVPTQEKTGALIVPSEAEPSEGIVYFGTGPAGGVTTGFNSAGTNPVVFQDPYQNEFAYNAALRQEEAQPIQMGQGFAEPSPSIPIQMGEGFTVAPMYNPQGISYATPIVDEKKEIGDEPVGNVTKRRLESGVWEFTYPDGRVVYSDNPSGPGQMMGSPGQRGAVSQGVSNQYRETPMMDSLYGGRTAQGRPYYTNAWGNSVLDPSFSNPYYAQGNQIPYARTRVNPPQPSGYYGLQQMQGPNGPVYTNVRGGSVLDPNIRPAPVRVPSRPAYVSDYDLPPETIYQIGNQPVYTNVRGGSVLDPNIRPAPVRVPSRPAYVSDYDLPPETIYQIGNQPVYTNVRGGSVLDPNIRPAPVRAPSSLVRTPMMDSLYGGRTAQGRPYYTNAWGNSVLDPSFSNPYYAQGNQIPYARTRVNPPQPSGYYGLQQMQGPNGPVYTNVRGGSVLDPYYRPSSGYYTPYVRTYGY